MTGGPRASLSTSKPVTATAAGLSLLGALRGLPAEGVGRDDRLGLRGRLSPQGTKSDLASDFQMVGLPLSISQSLTFRWSRAYFHLVESKGP